MGDALLLALAASGRGVSPNTLHALMAMRKRNYEKLAAFIRWLATALSYGWYWLKERPKVVGLDGKPDYSGEGTQVLIDAFWKRQDQKDFVGNMIRAGADLVLEWFKPDDYEWEMWTGLISAPSAASQLPALFETQQAGLDQLFQQLQQQLLPAGSGGPLLPVSTEARPGTRRPEAAPIDPSARIGSANNPVKSRLGGL